MSPRGFRQAAVRGLGQRVYYGWVVLSVAGLALFASAPGQSHTFSVFVGPIGRELGIGSTAIASAYGLATLLASLALPFMGRLIDRHGPRRMTLAVGAGLGLACLLFGAATNFLWLGLGFAALRFLGQGSLLLNSSNLVAHWFDRKRGLAMSLMVLGFAASMAVHPPLAEWLIARLGWREAWVVLGLLTWLLLLPPVLLLVHDRPEEIGLAPDGARRATDAADAT